MKHLLALTTALAMAFPVVAAAQDIDGSKFRTLEEGDWYRQFEMAQLTNKGVSEELLVKILTNIETATGARALPDMPDTIIDYGPGNWVYEFTTAADALAAEGKYHEAVLLYHTASQPHLPEKHGMAALEKAYDTYERAAEPVVGHFEEVDIPFEGKEFEIFLHLPKGDGPFPVLITSMGSDMSKAALLDYFVTALQPKGIAMITLDTPGMGSSNQYDVSDGRTDKLYAATVDWAKGQDEIDANNIFVQGVSFSGNAAARIFLDKPELDLAGVIYMCGPLHSALMAPPHVIDSFPKFTIDGVKTRMGLATDTSSQDLSPFLQNMSLDTQGLFDGPMIDTPLLALNTNDDPSSPLADMDRLIARASDVETLVWDLPGHCMPHHQREAIASAWIVANLR